MGAGRPLEAEFSLIDSVPRGTYTLVADGIITGSVDVTFEILWRRPGAVSTDTVLATWEQHFEPRGGDDFDAQPFEKSVQVQAIDYQPGDQLVWRYNGVNGASPMAYVPNGDGRLANGRIPHITSPP